MKKEKEGEVFIKDLDISVRTKYVLLLLNVYTLADLYLMYVLDTIPAINAVIKFYPETSMGFIYSEEIDQEVRDLLKVHCDVEELDHVGVG